MRAVLFICACAWYSVVGQDINSMRDMPKYDSRYDYLDVDAILDSKRLVKNYVECLINQYRCTPEGKALKRILPEALRTKCIRCTEKQKRTAVKVIKRLKYEYPEEWAKLASRWDPTGDFTRYFENVLAKNFNNFYGVTTSAPEATESPSSRPIPSETTQPPPPTFAPSTTPTIEGMSTEPRPVILNRFGDDGELMIGSPTSVQGNPNSSPVEIPMRTTKPPHTTRPPMRPNTILFMGTSPRYPLQPGPVYTTAVTLIDQLGYKIMRTTELVSDILRNTVRAVIGVYQ